jgi:glycosyltransferase involved in cell wall biosynthesis
MITELSILIPCYNSVCLDTVKRLQQLCERVAYDAPDGFSYEIIVADDASTDTLSLEQNQAISLLRNCTFLRKEQNTGSAATRNYLADHSRYPWLLFLDSDMQIPGMDFIIRYLPYDQYDVVNGGIAVGGSPNPSNLRYLYEKHSEPRHTIDHCNAHPYQQFRSTNFLISRACFTHCRFDERFTRSGYEDVHFGKQLCETRATIMYIHNPLILCTFESNDDYISKCERNLQTLHRFRDELSDYSPLLTLVRHLSLVAPLIRLTHRLLGPLERRHLTSHHPTLLLFHLYRLGYYLSIRS